MERAGFSLEARTAAEEEEGGRMMACEVEAAEALAGLARFSALRGGDLTSGELERQLVTHSQARTVAVEEEGGRMVACEVEAAEALAGLARFSALRGGDVTSGELERQLVTHSQEKLMAAQEFNDYTSTRITSPEKIEKNIFSKLRGRNFQSNSVSKSRPKLTEGEKQARKLRRILANREAARETIRRRQAMFLDLNRKSADVLEENENLKKEKELAVEEYNSLKERNEFLKAQLAKTKKAEPGDHMQEDPKTSRAEKHCSRPNQPPIVPCFWPPIFPPSDVFKFQCASHSHYTSSSQFPLFLYPVPWLIPFFAHGSTPHSHHGTKDTENPHQCSTCLFSETLPHEANCHLSTNRSMREREASNSRKSMAAGGVHGPGSTFPPESGDEDATHNPDGTIFVPGLFTRVKPQETPGPNRNDVGVGSSPKIQESIIEPHKETEDILTAAESRRRRKELMKMKNVPFRHHVNTHY